MVANWPGTYWFHGLAMNLATVRKTRDNKVSHLFTEFTNGAASGFNIAYCNRGGWSDTGITDNNNKNKWVESPGLKLCNNCMRAWRKEQRKHKWWIGEP